MNRENESSLAHRARFGGARPKKSGAGKIVGDEEANRLLRDADRGYRAPYVVPEEV